MAFRQSRSKSDDSNLQSRWNEHLARKPSKNLNTKLLGVERARLMKDKFSRLFHDFDYHSAPKIYLRRDEVFRDILSKRSKHKTAPLLRKYFSRIFDRKKSKHPLCQLLSRFTNLFHGQYSFSPEMFKQKSIVSNRPIPPNNGLSFGTGHKNSISFSMSMSMVANVTLPEERVMRRTGKTLKKAIDDVKLFIKKFMSLTCDIYPEILNLRSSKFIVQAVFHKSLFSQLQPTLFDLYQIKNEVTERNFARFMSMMQNLTLQDIGVSPQFWLLPSKRPPIIAAAVDPTAEGVVSTSPATSPPPSASSGRNRNQSEPPRVNRIAAAAAHPMRVTPHPVGAPKRLILSAKHKKPHPPTRHTIAAPPPVRPPPQPSRGALAKEKTPPPVTSGLSLSPSLLPKSHPNSDDISKQADTIATICVPEFAAEWRSKHVMRMLGPDSSKASPMGQPISRSRDRGSSASSTGLGSRNSVANSSGGSLLGDDDTGEAFFKSLYASHMSDLSSQASNDIEDEKDFSLPPSPQDSTLAPLRLSHVSATSDSSVQSDDVSDPKLAFIFYSPPVSATNSRRHTALPDNNPVFHTQQSGSGSGSGRHRGHSRSNVEEIVGGKHHRSHRHDAKKHSGAALKPKKPGRIRVVSNSGGNKMMASDDNKVGLSLHRMNNIHKMTDQILQTRKARFLSNAMHRRLSMSNSQSIQFGTRNSNSFSQTPPLTYIKPTMSSSSNDAYALTLNDIVRESSPLIPIASDAASNPKAAMTVPTELPTNTLGLPTPSDSPQLSAMRAGGGSKLRKAVRKGSGDGRLAAALKRHSVTKPVKPADMVVPLHSTPPIPNGTNQSSTAATNASSVSPVENETVAETANGERPSVEGVTDGDADKANEGGSESGECQCPSTHNPYQSAVEEVKRMQKATTPEDKIQCVVKTAEILRLTINDFYENRTKEPLQITPDDLLCLFAYVLIHANVHALWSEVELIDDFVVDNLRMAMPGYYLATVRAAMQLIVTDLEKFSEILDRRRQRELLGHAPGTPTETPAGP